MAYGFHGWSDSDGTSARRMLRRSKRFSTCTECRHSQRQDRIVLLLLSKIEDESELLPEDSLPDSGLLWKLHCSAYRASR